MDVMTIVSLLARHGLTAIGGVLVKNGVLDAGSTETFVGSAMFLAGIGWSVWQKYGMVMVDAGLARIHGVHPEQK